MVLEKTLESPLDCKASQTVNPKGNQSWIFIGRTDAEAEAPRLWPPDSKSLLIRKDSDAGEDWRQEEKGMTEDEVVGWHHWLSEYEFEQTPGDSEGQWRTVKPGVLQSMGLQRVGHDWVSEQQLYIVNTVLILSKCSLILNCDIRKLFGFQIMTSEDQEHTKVTTILSHS